MGRRRLLPAVLGAVLLLGGCTASVTDVGGDRPADAPAAAGAPVAGAPVAGGSQKGTAEPAEPAAETDGTTTLPAPTVPLRSVVDAAIALDASAEGDLGVVVVDLQTRERASYNPHAQVHPASLYKLFVAATALHLVDQGILTLDTPVGAGACATVESAMGYMITVSDNACARTLATHVGWDVVESWVRHREFDDTTFMKVEDGTGAWVQGLSTSPGDVADLLVRLEEGDLLSPTSTTHLAGLLEAQYFSSPLSEELGAVPGAVFGHKLGTLADVSHDAGILEVDGRRYVVVVVTSGWPSGAGTRAAPLLAGVGTAVRAYVEDRAG